MKFIAGCNTPGYLPVAEPMEFSDWQDACEFIATTIELDADENDETDTAIDALRAEFDTLARGEVQDVERMAPNGLVYWIMRGANR